MNSLRRFFTNGRLAVIFIIVSLTIDQLIKIWVKTNMTLHESIRITNWFYITFIENSGMAYGMEIGSKLALSLFRIVAISFILYYIYLEIKRKSSKGYVLCLSMIAAGAIGNLLDCMFYGLIFNGASEAYTSYFVPFGSGYAPFLMGKVVDMFYFPLIVTTWPDWMPFWGGQHFVFFSPVFNFADANISVGFILLLLFYRKEISNITLKGDKKSQPLSGE
jgi:signal peptidase II